MKSIFFSLCILLIPFADNQLKASDVSDWQQKPSLELGVFAEVFYVYDFNKPGGNSRLPFLYNYNRHNEFNLNIGLIRLSIEHKKYRSNIALQTGTYPNDNYADEPGILKSIHEANIGITLNTKNNLWVDVGILPSHIGFESAQSIDKGPMTRSLLAENSPYYSAGAKLSYLPNSKIEVSALLLNGWQRIQRLEGSSSPAFGTQLLFRPSETLTINWSTFIGTDEPDSTRKWRYFNNLYSSIEIGSRFSLITGFDIGIQQKRKFSSAYDYWLSPVLIGKIALSKRFSTAFRAEYYLDPNHVIMPVLSNTGFNVVGLSANLNFSPIDQIIWRLEGRYFNSTDNIFERDSKGSRSNFFLGTSLAIRFSEVLTSK